MQQGLNSKAMKCKVSHHRLDDERLKIDLPKRKVPRTLTRARDFPFIFNLRFPRLMLLGEVSLTCFPSLSNSAALRLTSCLCDRLRSAALDEDRGMLRVITVTNEGSEFVPIVIIYVRSVCTVIDIAVSKNGDFATFGVSPSVSPAVKQGSRRPAR